jgi:hypothetical protein
MIWRLVVAACLTLGIVAFGAPAFAGPSNNVGFTNGVVKKQCATQQCLAQFNGCPAGFCSPGSVAATGCSQATTFLARTSGLSGAQQTAYRNFFCATDSLGTNGINCSGGPPTFDLIDAFWTNTTTTALLNLCSTSFTGTLIGPPTFTANSGFSGSAVAQQYISSNYNPATAGGADTQNCAAASVRMLGATGTQPVAAMTQDNTLGDGIYAYFSDGNSYARINDNPQTGGFTNPGSTQVGFWLGNRSSSTARQFYYNGASVGTYGSSPSQAPLSSIVDYLSYSAAVASNTGTIGFATYGGCLSSTNVTDLYNREEAFGHAMGAF